MLTEDQVNQVWDDALGAEVRSLYFADLGSTYTKRKQIISGLSFFLSSGAAAAVVARMPAWVPVLLSVLTAILMAYSIAVGLDRKAATMAKLHYSWDQIESDYRNLWNYWYNDDAEDTLKDIRIRSREASQLAITEAPYKENLIQKWRAFVYRQHGITQPTEA